MMRLTLPSLASLAGLLFLSAAACSPKLGEDTAGDQGTLRFQYSDTNTCLLGCGLERTALQGALVTITATGNDGNARFNASLSDESIGRITAQRDSCSCNSTSSGHGQSRTIDRSQACNGAETKQCSLSIDIDTVGAGDAKLQIVDDGDRQIDSVSMHVGAASRIDIDVREGGTKVADDTYEVREGYKVKLGSSVYDANGDAMIWAGHGVSHDYADETLIKPDTAVLVGSTDVEDMIAGNRTGQTSVKVSAPGAAHVVSFRVVP